MLKDGYEVERNFFGSQDGEAIVYRKIGENDWHILTHMDSDFASCEDIEDLINLQK